MDSLGAGHSTDTFSVQDVLIFISYQMCTKHICIGIKCNCFVQCMHVMSQVAISVRVTAILVYPGIAIVTCQSSPDCHVKVTLTIPSHHGLSAMHTVAVVMNNIIEDSEIH